MGIASNWFSVSTLISSIAESVMLWFDWRGKSCADNISIQNLERYFIKRVNIFVANSLKSTWNLCSLHTLQKITANNH